MSYGCVCTRSTTPFGADGSSVVCPGFKARTSTKSPGPNLRRLVSPTAKSARWSAEAALLVESGASLSTRTTTPLPQAKYGRKETFVQPASSIAPYSTNERLVTSESSSVQGRISNFWPVKGFRMATNLSRLRLFCSRCSRRSCFVSCCESSKASLLTTSASRCAFWADVAALPASCVTSASNWSLLALNSLVIERNWLLIDANLRLAPASPKMPATTSTVAAASNQSFPRDGRSGGRMMPRRQSLKSSRYCQIIPIISAATPKATPTEQTQASVSHCPDDCPTVFKELSNAEMQLFRADMAESKAEAAGGKIEAALAACWIITAARQMRS